MATTPNNVLSDPSSVEAFARTMIEEGIEREIRQDATEAIRDLIARGMTPGPRAAKSIIERIMSPQSATHRKALGLTGFALPLFSSGIAGIIKQPSLWDSILPNDSSPMVRFIKGAMKMLVPSVIIGGGEALGDAFNRVVDTKLSDPTTTAEADRTKEFDFLVEAFALPGRVFVARRHTDGRLMLDSSGLPMISDPDWNNFLRTARMVAPDKPIQHRLIDFETAASRVESGMLNPLDAAAIAAAIRSFIAPPAAPATPKTTLAGVTTETWAVIRAAAATLSKREGFALAASIDYIQDPFKLTDGKYDLDKINVLGQYFGAIVNVPGQRPHFTEEVLEEIECLCRLALGAKSEMLNRVWSIFRQFNLRRTTSGLGTAFKWLFSVARWTVIFTILTFLVFAVSSVAFIFGIFGSGNPNLVEGAKITATCLVWGATGMLVTIAISRVADVPMNLLAKLLGTEFNIVTNIGRLISFGVGVLCPLMMIAALAPVGAASFAMTRYYILAGIIAIFGATMGLKSSGWFGESKLWAHQSATKLRALGTSMIVLALVTLFIISLQAFGLDVWGLVGKTFTGMADYFHRNSWFAALTFTAIYGVLVLTVLHFTKGLRSDVNNGTRTVHPLPWYVQIGLFIGAIIVFCLPFQHNEDWQANASAPVSTVSSSSPAPVSQAVAVPEVTVTREQLAAESRQRVARHTVSAPQQTPPSTTEAECASMTFRMRKMVAACRQFTGSGAGGNVTYVK